MKNSILFVALIFSVVACNNAQTPEPAKAATPVQEKTSSQSKKQQTQVIMSTARPKSQIESNYPFDIELKTATGDLVNSAQVLKKNGKPTILLFWLTTCMPCRAELNALKKVYADYANDQSFNLVAISTDFSKNFDAFVTRVEESDWEWEAYNDVNREFREVMPGGLNGLPQTFIFDKDGKIVYHKRKYRGGDEIILLEKAKAIAMQ
ncbi:MAG: TlpA disulfide reductase family protein [Bacteroidota bacterium]